MKRKRKRISSKEPPEFDIKVYVEPCEEWEQQLRLETLAKLIIRIGERKLAKKKEADQSIKNNG
jgi:hypothetical protein